VILSSLVKNIDPVLARITLSQLQRYSRLCSELRMTNIVENFEYRRMFNGFYRMQRRSQDWYNYYFSLLESKKNSVGVTFRDIIEQIYREQKRIEPSFSSKLVATLCPEKPIYDRYIGENLSLTIPAAHWNAEHRMSGYIEMYSNLEDKMNCLIHDARFLEILKPAFDTKFSEYENCFTDVKKLDFLLWQHRNVITYQKN
jgi:hypothetical protein